MNKSKGEIIIDAVVRAAAINRVIVGIDGTTTFVWEANSPEQIEAAIRESGYELTKIKQEEKP